MLQTAARLGIPTEPAGYGLPPGRLWRMTPAALRREAQAYIDAKTEDHKAAWTREITAACIIANRIPQFSDGAEALDPSDILAAVYGDAPEAESLEAFRERQKEIDAEMAEQGKRARAAAQAQKTPPTPNEP